MVRASHTTTPWSLLAPSERVLLESRYISLRRSSAGRYSNKATVPRPRYPRRAAGPAGDCSSEQVAGEGNARAIRRYSWNLQTLEIFELLRVIGVVRARGGSERARRVKLWIERDSGRAICEGGGLIEAGHDADIGIGDDPPRSLIHGARSIGAAAVPRQVSPALHDDKNPGTQQA